MTGRPAHMESNKELQLPAILLTVVELPFSKLMYNSISIFREYVIAEPQKIDTYKAVTSFSGMYLNSLLNYTHEQFWDLVCSNHTFHRVWSALNFAEHNWGATAVCRYYDINPASGLGQAIHTLWQPHDYAIEERYNTEPWFVKGKGWDTTTLKGRYGIYVEDMRSIMRWCDAVERQHNLIANINTPFL